MSKLKTYKKSESVPNHEMAKLVARIRELGGTEADLKRYTGLERIGYLADSGRDKQQRAETYNALVAYCELLEVKAASQRDTDAALVVASPDVLRTIRPLIESNGGTFSEIVVWK